MSIHVCAGVFFLIYCLFVIESSETKINMFAWFLVCERVRSFVRYVTVPRIVRISIAIDQNFKMV